eukprot:365922-Chlamydomonas_euryale.AAC.6
MNDVRRRSEPRRPSRARRDGPAVLAGRRVGTPYVGARAHAPGAPTKSRACVRSRCPSRDRVGLGRRPRAGNSR